MLSREYDIWVDGPGTGHWITDENKRALVEWLARYKGGLNLDMEPLPEILTIGEAKLRQEIRKGRIPHVRIGTKIILRKMALDAWAAEQERQSVARAKGRPGVQGK